MIEQIKLDDNNPLVSIIITCWGSKEYIREAIESALAQTYKPIEVIVLEDCGNDGTYEEALKIKDPRLRVLRNEKNLGNYTNKNQGLEYTHGPLLKYLDGDDVLEKDCLERLVEYWKIFHPRAGIIFGQFTLIDQYGKHLATPHAWGITGLCSGIKVLDWITRAKLSGSRFGNTTPNLFERRFLELVGGFPEGNCWSGDQETFLKLLCVTDAAFVSESVARFRMQPGSIGHTFKHDIAVKDNIAMIERLYTFFQNQQGLPDYLTNPQFIKEWKVWVNAHFILGNYRRKIMGRSNRYNEIRAIFEEKGLGWEFKSLLLKRFLPSIFNVLMRKLRVFLNLPEGQPLFGPGFRRT
jgi:glycosyltransferase involved in cell wall biosynthesis